MRIKFCGVLLLLGVFSGHSNTVFGHWGRRGYHQHPQNQHNFNHGWNNNQNQQNPQFGWVYPAQGFIPQQQGFGQNRPPNSFGNSADRSDSNEGDIQQVRRDANDPQLEHYSSLIQERLNQQKQDLGGEDAPEITCPKGTFIGVKEVVAGKVVYAFYGIPYAKPPIRFKSPEMVDKIEEPYLAREKPPACSQSVVKTEAFGDFEGEEMWSPNKSRISEDCLYLNIWVPKTVFDKRNDEEGEAAAVLFWIYGGGFFSGSSSLDVYDGGALAVTQDIVVVSPQYRVGPMGFLYLGTDDAPGNMGLLDQNLALQWTRENVESFGGDPYMITAAGESAGSSCVGYHLLSPRSKPYLKRGIMMSGLPDQSYSYNSPETMKERSLQLASYAGCHQKDLKELVRCLRGKDADDLNKLQWKLWSKILEFPFTPTIDGYFIKESPSDTIRKGMGKRGEVLMGTVKDEGSYFLLYHYVYFLKHLEGVDVSYERFLDMVHELFQDYPEGDREVLITEYTNWENPEDGRKNLQILGDMLGDEKFTCAQRRFADDWSRRGLPVYFYHFTERLSANPWGKWMGVMHGDDILLFFGAALRNESKFTPEEKAMTLNFMKMIGNFVKNGEPSKTWEKYRADHPVYLDVNATKISSSSSPNVLGPRPQKCAFWNKMLPLIWGLKGVVCDRAFVDAHSARGGFRPYPESMSGMTVPSRPQWVSNGQGVHGGQGFSQNELHSAASQLPPYPPLPPPPSSCVGQGQHQAPSLPYPPMMSSYGFDQHFGMPMPPSVNQPTELPNPSTTSQTSTEKSCKCTVQEGQTDIEQNMVEDIDVRLQKGQSIPPPV